MTTVKELVHNYHEDLVKTRRHLHENPELSWEEFETTNYVCAFLDTLEIPYKRMEPTGVIAEIKGVNPGKTVALRADMDALSVYEINQQLSYASKIDGKMHACGHDAHTAMLLTATRILKQLQHEINGTVRLIFQPAEEVANGAKKMVAQGAVEGVDNVFGIHIWSQIDSGKVQCAKGAQFASADLFSVRFKGRGGHAAQPHNAIDAVMMASSFALNAQTVVARTIDPIQPAVLTIGKMDVGTRFNVIAENALIEGTVRCFDAGVRKHVEQSIRHYAEQTAILYGGTAEVTYDYGTQAVINGKESASLVQEIVETHFGKEAYWEDDPTMGGEDFSYYLDEVPGCFALVGCGNTEKDTRWAHHNGHFNVDEEAMDTGVELYVQYALNYLNR